jgi:hypothetical protein
MPISALVTRLAIVLVDDQFERHIKPPDQPAARLAKVERVVKLNLAATQLVRAREKVAAAAGEVA